MLRRALATGLLIAAFTLNAFPGFLRKSDFVPASFDGYEVTLADGVTIDIGVAGGRILLNSDVNREYEIILSKCKTSKVVRKFSYAGGSYDIDISSFMNEGELYYIEIVYDAFGRTISNGNNIIFKSGNNIHFWKSDSYEYNLDKCSEMWTDEQSLRECLEPQNDIECDDPVLIGYSERICEGAKDDWEKVFRIYSYIVNGMAYDNVEADGRSGGYQDSAVDVIRDGKSICEGFGNAFTALCRAQGIPACVEFGMGYSSYEEMTGKKKDDDIADHAWAAVFLGGKWHFVDPTYDISRYYNGPDNIETYEETTTYYLLALESFSNDHKIYDADTRHGIASSGSCGEHAEYKITRDGVCYISGYGTLKMPKGVNGFSKIVFDEDCTIDVIDDYCFYDCDLITTVILPDTVEKIEEFAFNTCEDLEYVYIPEGCHEIGNQAFCYCEELSYVRIPDSIWVIGGWAFDDCPRLYISVPRSYANFSRYDTKPMFIEER